MAVIYIHLSQESFPHNRLLMRAACNWLWFELSCHHQADLWNIPTCPECHNIICDVVLWEKLGVTHFNSIAWSGGPICFSCSLAPAEITCPVLTANTLSSKCLSRCCGVSGESGGRERSQYLLDWIRRQWHEPSSLLVNHILHTGGGQSMLYLPRNTFSNSLASKSSHGLIQAGISSSGNANEGETSRKMFDKKTVQLSHWKL